MDDVEPDLGTMVQSPQNQDNAIEESPMGGQFTSKKQGGVQIQQLTKQIEGISSLLQNLNNYVQKKSDQEPPQVVKNVSQPTLKGIPELTIEELPDDQENTPKNLKAG